MKKEKIDDLEAPKHCGEGMELKWLIYDGGWGDTGSYLFFQCKTCGLIERWRVNPTKTK